MPSISKYRALGKTLGGYKKSLGEIRGLEYAKERVEEEGEKQRAMYGQIGASIGSILGLAQEYNQMSKMKQYEKGAADLPGIVTEQEEYQPLGGFGERIGLGKKTRDVYKSRYTGRQIDQSMMRAIGYQESLGIETKYSDIQGVSDMYARGEGYNPVRARAFEQAGVKTQSEYDKLIDPEKIDWKKAAEDFKPDIPIKGDDVDIADDVKIEEYEGLSDFSEPLPELSPKRGSRGLKARRRPAKPGEMTIDSRGIRSPKLVPPVKERVEDGIMGALQEGEPDIFGESPRPDGNIGVAESMMMDKFGVSSSEIEKLTSSFASVESGGRNIKQELKGEVGSGLGTGPGEGIYQFETKQGSGAFQVALKRTEKLYKKGGMETPDWILDAKRHDSPLKLTEGQQGEVLLADLYMKAGSDEYLKSAFQSNDYKDLWLNMHWAGDKSLYGKQSDKWDKIVLGQPSKSATSSMAYQRPGFLR